MGSWESSETIFLQHAVSDLSTYILTHKTYRLKEKLHQEYTIIEQNIYALLESLHSTLNVLKRYVPCFLNSPISPSLRTPRSYPSDPPFTPLNHLSHYKIFGKLNHVDRCSEEDEEEEEEWVTEEIVDIEHNKVYTCEVAI